jgi:hypothetical protein
MKLTIEQVEARMTTAWGKKAFVISHRLAGNRYGYVVTDHSEHWLPLLTSWVGGGGRQLFEPADGYWPDFDTTADPWSQAVMDAMQLALAYFVGQGNKAAEKRLPRAQVIAEAQNWTRLGDRLDTWLIPSSTKAGVLYRVNGRCTCPDYERRAVPGGWCKHRLARALAKRAAEILKKENGAEGASNTPAPDPEGSHEDLECTTTPLNGQAQRIDVTVAFETDEAKTLPRINGSGHLIAFKADGQQAEPPAQTMRELYRWLQEHGYVPADFQWLAWEHGLRHRLQTYILVDDRDTALPVQSSRGRSKLFKEGDR